ncbi:hypothetical protein OPV22_025141 [Ensete ventricosum]|uniref:Pentacotripeptide-repeat region of PRORP domain-containing protein n=1 Tax=Ensete ventricosum TaxID=4639 RepID=A0AAV8QIS2_ENSVE|nr:hypothetical protein OPV22_025141 [Ensete ventricosum]
MAAATNSALASSSSAKGRLLFYGAAPSSSVLLPISSSLPSSPTRLRSSTRPPCDQQLLPKDWELRHRTLLVDSFHRNNGLRALLLEVSDSKGSGPLRVLTRDGDWPDDHFWAVVALLVETGRADEALKVFDSWKKIEMTRTNVANYSRIIKLFCRGNLMSEAISAFQAMEECDLVPSLAIYNAIIHGFARKKDFDNSNATFRMMLEAGLLPTPETYNGLIRAYGSFGLNDEMSKCVKRMESSGCFPDEVTYNTLITEFARSGLTEKMEGVCRVLGSKHMKLQISTLVAMLEAYADLGMLAKMEKVYRRVLRSDGFIKENLIRKLATVYIKNYRFAQLEELGNDISAKSGRTDLVWHIMLLSSACLLSKKGVESLVQEMKLAKVTVNITITNILAHFYLNMKDFKSLDIVFLQAKANKVKPDVMTIGVFFDACKIGYDGTWTLERWIKNGSLEEVVGLKADQLVVTAFGKGFFLKLCEKHYSSLHPKEKEKKLWRYSDMIKLVFGKKSKGKD